MGFYQYVFFSFVSFYVKEIALLKHDYILKNINYNMYILKLIAF